MMLPGKVAICYLEEDVPQKAYFRIKPLFLKEEHGFEPVRDARECLPDEGGIRIVPDKNESSRFKVRMRTLGKFCLLDLTGHPNENDKIRPNKNYNLEKLENNRNIVYSDVIALCPADWLMQAIRTDALQDGQARLTLSEKPITSNVALISRGVVSYPYTYTVNENGEYIFTASENGSLTCVEEAAYAALYQTVISETERYELAVTADGPVVRSALPEKAEPANPEAPEAPACPPEEAQAPERAKIKEELQPEPPVPSKPMPIKAEKPSEPAPVKAEKPSEPAPVKAEKPSEPAKEPAKPAEPEAKEAPAAEKPRGEAKPRLRELALHPAKLNPRRAKSLSEIVDDGWRKSRMDQFGAPVPVDVTGMPVVSPVEHAADILKRAWALKEARNLLADEILSLEDFADMAAPLLVRHLSGPLPETQLEKLNSLTAEKLKILTEIDELRLRRMDKRAELMEEARGIHTAEVKKMKNAIDQLKAERKKALKECEQAKEALALAKNALNQTLDDAAKSDLVRFIMAVSHQAPSEDAPDYSDFSGTPATYEPTGAQLVSDVRMKFEKSGRALTNDEAVNLLACVALSRFVLLSGATGSGKTALAKNIANALGLTAPGKMCCQTLPTDGKDVPSNAKFKALASGEDHQTLRVLVLDDVNSVESQQQAAGLIGWTEENAESSSVRVLMTLLDDQIGYPLNPRLFDRAFTIRVKHAEPEQRASGAPVECAEATVSLEALSKIFSINRPVPALIEERLSALTAALGSLHLRLSERTLSDMRAYCAAVTPLMTCGPIEVLDYAFSQRAMPYLLATARMEALEKLPELLCDLPRSLSLMNEPLPLPPL